jgi:hypothetical protein
MVSGRDLPTADNLLLTGTTKEQFPQVDFLVHFQDTATMEKIVVQEATTNTKI